MNETLETIKENEKIPIYNLIEFKLISFFTSTIREILVQKYIYKKKKDQHSSVQYCYCFSRAAIESLW